MGQIKAPAQQLTGLQNYILSRRVLSAGQAKLIKIVVTLMAFGMIFGMSFMIATPAYAAYSSGTVVSMTNSERAKAGLGTLSVNGALTSAATAKANDMFAKGYFAHTSPDGRTPWDFIAGSGYDYVYAGENLAIGYSSASELMSAWMNSPTHRDNILSSKFREIGIAVVSGQYDGAETTIVVQEFGAQVAAEAQPASQEQTQDTAGEADQGNPTPTPAPAVSNVAPIDINKAKSTFIPKSIFENEEIEIKIILTGQVQTLEVQAGEAKTNLLENSTISSSGDEKTYSAKLKLTKAGSFDVMVNATSTQGSKDTENLGRVEVKPALISNASGTKTAGFKEILKETWIYIVLGGVLLAGIGYFIFRRYKFGKLAKLGTAIWDL